ncbi:MAG: oligopeptide transporter permease, partial [Thiolinea sp.]
MFSYALRRLLTAIPVLWIALTACFFTLRLAPGGPFDGERQLPEKILENLRAHYDLDKSLFEQYFLYLSRVLSGDLGPSFVTVDFTVAEMLAQGLPYTLILGGTAFVVSVVFGILTGVL